MTTWPQASVPAFPAGYGPLTSDMTTWLQDNFAFLTAGVVFRGEQTANQTLNTGGFDALQATAVEDPYGGWSTSATASQAAWSWLAPYTGWYEVAITAYLPVGSWTQAAVSISGAAAQAMQSTALASTIGGGCSASLIVPLTGGVDYVQAGVIVSATSGTDPALGPSWYPSIEITWVSNG